MCSTMFTFWKHLVVRSGTSGPRRHDPLHTRCLGHMRQLLNRDVRRAHLSRLAGFPLRQVQGNLNVLFYLN